MFNLSNFLLTIGAFAVISGVATIVRAYRVNRRKEAAPFLHHFESEYDRNLFPQNTWDEDEHLYHLQTRVSVVKVRDPSDVERYSRDSGATRRH